MPERSRNLGLVEGTFGDEQPGGWHLETSQGLSPVVLMQNFIKFETTYKLNRAWISMPWEESLSLYLKASVAE